MVDDSEWLRYIPDVRKNDEPSKKSSCSIRIKRSSKSLIGNLKRIELENFTKRFDSEIKTDYIPKAL